MRLSFITITVLIAIAAPVFSHLEVVKEVATSPNPHNRFLATTSLCDDRNCIKCNTTSKNNCIDCRSTYVKRLDAGKYVCLSCYGCSHTGCSMSSSARKTCNSCKDGFKRINYSGSIYYCAQEFRSSNAGLGLVVILGMWLFIAAACIFGRWCCNEMMHKSYSYEKVVLANQPPPFQG